MEALSADRAGQYSVRINDKWRICFVWKSDAAHGVMKPMGVSARQLAADIDVSRSRISELVNGQRPITADIALRLGIPFGMEPRFLLNLQSEYDLRVADWELRAKPTPRIRVLQPVAS